MIRSLTLLLFLLLLSSCFRPVAEKNRGAVTITDRPIRVVCTTGMVADMVGAVGGDRIELKSLMGAGVDPHSYKARESDVLAIASADVVFTSGLHLEAKLGEVLERIGGNVYSVQLAAQVDPERLLEGDDPSHPDPHIWFDVNLWAGCISVVEQTLAKVDPTHAEGYQNRAESYRTKLEALDILARELTSSVPESQRVLVTAHDAFGYFGRAYGFEVVGLQGISTAAEAGAGDVRRLAEMIAERKIRAVFIESSVPERNVRAVQEAVKARGWSVALGGELFSDAMGVAGTEEGTYLGMVEHNVRTIVGALSDQPQPNGEDHGK